METILITTDFSSSAINAAKYVANLSKTISCKRIIVYHSAYNDNPQVVLVTEVLMAVPDGDAIDDEILNLLASEKADLEKIVNPETIIDTIVNNQSLLDGIYEIVNNESVDLVAIGLYGAGNNGANMVGSQTANLIKNKKFPVLVIPKNVSFQKINKALFACDLKNVRENLPVDKIIDSLQQLHVRLVIVNVEYNESQYAIDYIEEETELHKLLEPLSTEFHYLTDKHTIDAVLDFAEELPAELIIVVPKQRGFIEQLFHESSSKKLAVKTPLPLLFFHQTDK